mmetsp:Transcript_13631/g.27165  ORF Transcript_13631/g.27165 Transcript_13631/m.27165 type:complete len:203 (+) Transcript_13631:240-848(+)
MPRTGPGSRPSAGSWTTSRKQKGRKPGTTTARCACCSGTRSTGTWTTPCWRSTPNGAPRGAAPARWNTPSPSRRRTWRTGTSSTSSTRSGTRRTRRSSSKKTSSRTPSGTPTFPTSSTTPGTGRPSNTSSCPTASTSPPRSPTSTPNGYRTAPSRRSTTACPRCGRSCPRRRGAPWSSRRWRGPATSASAPKYSRGRPRRAA